MSRSGRYNLRGGGVPVDAVDVGGSTTGTEGDVHKDHMVVDKQDERSSVSLEKGHGQTYRYKFIDVIEVSVGSQSFQVHRNVVCERSAFFKAAASEAWNAEHQAIKLAEEEPSTFDSYLKCLYHGAPEVNVLTSASMVKSPGLRSGPSWSEA